VLPAIKQTFEGAVTTIRGVVKIISGILHGDFGKAWDGVKLVFAGGIKGAIGMIRMQTAAAREAASQIGSAIVHGIGDAIRAGAGLVKDAINSLIPSGVRKAIGKVGGAGKSLLDSITGATGAFIDAPASHGDVVPALLKGGEVVLNEPQQRMVGQGAIFGALRATGAKTIGPGGGPAMLAGGAVIGPSAVSRMQSFANSMSGRNLPYTFGGGHSNFAPSPGYDCSGFVSAILHAGGALSSPMAVRQPLQGQLVPGPGKFVTVGIRGTSGRNAHTMIKVGGAYYESGGGGNGAHRRAGWNGSFDLFHPANEATKQHHRLGPAARRRQRRARHQEGRRRLGPEGRRRRLELEPADRLRVDVGRRRGRRRGRQRYARAPLTTSTRSGASSTSSASASRRSRRRSRASSAPRRPTRTGSTPTSSRPASRRAPTTTSPPATRLRDFYKGKFDTAVAANDPLGIIEWGGKLKGAQDSLDALTTAVTDNTAAIQAQNDLLKSAARPREPPRNISEANASSILRAFRLDARRARRSHRPWLPGSRRPRRHARY
jgi:hypothetical protein